MFPAEWYVFKRFPLFNGALIGTEGCSVELELELAVDLELLYSFRLRGW